MQGVLSGDILEEEILPRIVDVKTLLRLRCVSKSCRSLIDSKRFINELQLQHSRKRFRCARRFRLAYLAICGGDEEECPIAHPANYHLTRCSIVVGHHNGLLCMLKLTQPSYFFLWNPATRIYTQLPFLEGFQFDVPRKLGFGWDEEAGAYKVFVGYCRYGDHHEGTLIAKLYSSNTNSWTTVEHGWGVFSHPYFNFGVFACGKIYWLTGNGKIESMDLNSGMFGATIEPPPPPPCKQGKEESMKLRLWETEGRLCIMRGARRFWVMDSSSNPNNPNVWVQHEQLATRLSKVCRLSLLGGAFSYFETLLSPSLFVHNN